MRVSRSLVLVSLALAVATSACMRRPGPRPVAIAAPVGAAPGAAGPAAAMAQAGPPVMAEPEPLYMLDSGDKLRIVVFGQEGLSNSYAVDPTGNITMPLIGPVYAREHTTAALSQSIAGRSEERRVGNEGSSRGDAWP